MDSTRLADGRIVSYEEYGDPAGLPVLWFHGAMASRLEAGVMADAAEELGVRLVALDRPGVGGSTLAPGRSLISYAADVVQVMDALDVEQTVLGGQSAGGAYAMAVAATVPDRVLRVVPYNSATPVADDAARSALSRAGRLAYGYMARNGEAFAAKMYENKPKGWLGRKMNCRNPDAAVLSQPGVAELWKANQAEVLAHPGSGYLALEMALVGAPWGFDHRAVQQPVAIVSGVKDGGLGYAKVWARELPNGRLVVVPGGHVGYADPAVARMVVEQLRGEV